MEEQLMRIGEIAAFFNVSAKAMRLYEKMEIIKPVKVDKATGYRYYTAEQVQQMNALIELKALGFSLAEIKSIMAGGTTGSQLIKALGRKKQFWEDAVSVAHNKMEAIEAITERLTRTRSGENIHELSEEERAWLLVKMVCVEDLRGQSVLSEALWL